MNLLKMLKGLETVGMSGKPVLIACEESQAVTIEFRNLGFEAYSCDIEPCSGGFPEWHIQNDVSKLLRYNWAMVIAFPPCTRLCISGAKHFHEKRTTGKQQDAIGFFLDFTRLQCPWAIENPVGIMSNIYRKPDQIIQPYEFGHIESKGTCLWLHKLPKLQPTNFTYRKHNRIHMMPGNKDQAKLRSKTFQGIAKAMAEQWSTVL